jgi:hypothetical protein
MEQGIGGHKVLVLPPDISLGKETPDAPWNKRQRIAYNQVMLLCALIVASEGKVPVLENGNMSKDQIEADPTFIAYQRWLKTPAHLQTIENSIGRPLNRIHTQMAQFEHLYQIAAAQSEVGAVVQRRPQP